MKEGIHPSYYPNAKATCACGEHFTVGATVPELHVEICSKCHPFYTGKQALIDTTGRVERFRARTAKASPAKKVKKARVSRKK